eukprot:Em0011g544a
MALLKDHLDRPGYGSLDDNGAAVGPSGMQPETACLSFHNVSYIVNKKLGPCKKQRKVVLNDVSGVLPSGLNAIMGPTGSGKTTLLDILAGRRSLKTIQGAVLVNGVQQPPNFRLVSGYVVQDDVIMGTLTVRENLNFSAALRLPSSMSYRERKQRVEKVILELGLTACADTKIGTEFLRGVSGGERKRTNIGMELIIEPQVLFLDEPTTGLDARTAASVVQLLKSLTRSNNRIVVMSIHQPRYSIYKLFDTITLLSQGSTVYHGPAEFKAVQYFTRAGFHCDQHENAADFFLDVISQCEHSTLTTGVAAATFDAKKTEIGKSIDLVDVYEQSEERRETAEQLSSIVRHSRDKRGHHGPIPAYATTFLWQLLVVTHRSGVDLLRNPATSLFQLLSRIILALLVGTIYYQLDDSKLGFQNRIGAFFFIITSNAFVNMSAVDLFIKQRAIFLHENASGYYRVSSFFIAKVVTDLIAARIIPLIVYCTIAYFMIGLEVEVKTFFIFLLTVCLASIASSSIAFAVSAGTSVTAIATMSIGLMYVMSMLFGGFLIALESLPEWLQWLKYASFFRYGTEALSINEMKDKLFGNCTGPLYDNRTCNFLSVCYNGTQELQTLGFEASTTWLWYDQIALGSMSLIILSIGYVVTENCSKTEVI